MRLAQFYRRSSTKRERHSKIHRSLGNVWMTFFMMMMIFVFIKLKQNNESKTEREREREQLAFGLKPIAQRLETIAQHRAWQEWGVRCRMIRTIARRAP